MSLASSTAARGGQSIPRLAEPFDLTPTSNPRPAAASITEAEDKKQHKKRGLFGFGKKKADDATALQPQSSNAASTNSADRRSATSPVRSENASPQNIARMPSSPSRALSSSPRLSSPAGSQIFERDVQESTVLIPNSPAIPSHIQTENYIPPVLDASSEAITDDHLDPDAVEIITHPSHLPAVSALSPLAAMTIASNASNVSNASEPGVAASWADELAASFGAGRDGAVVDSASNYGSLDTTDVRRLSFISFADVVQAEHQQQQQQQQQQHHQQVSHGGLGSISSTRDSMHLAGLTSLSSGRVNRSPSPIRSPVSSAGGGPGTSPPTSKSGSVKGIELSPSRRPLGSPTATSGGATTGSGIGSELNIETMTQALRRTGSSDLSGVRSFPTSPI